MIMSNHQCFAREAIYKKLLVFQFENYFKNLDENLLCQCVVFSSFSIHVLCYISFLIANSLFYSCNFISEINIIAVAG